MTALQQLTDKDINALTSWYKKHQRDFPWRKDPNPYWVWLAEIMSQQTVMAALMPYFYRFTEKFPTIHDLAEASEDEVLKAWTGLGYYSRARNVHKAAKHIAYALKGAFPKTYEGWLELPGVGPYTAAAISSQCFGVKEPVWDGNVTRVTARLEARSDVWEQKFAAAMKEALRGKIQEHDASQFNQAFMELGATVCTPKSPACGRCPISKACKAYAKNAVEKFPPPKPRKQNVELAPRVHVLLRQSRNGKYETWVTRRPDSYWFNGMWDFPSELGGSKGPLVELKSLSKKSGIEFGKVRHQITHHKITLVGIVEFSNKAPKTDGQWIAVDELLDAHPPIPLSTTARKTLKALMGWFADASVQQLCLNMS